MALLSSFTGIRSAEAGAMDNPFVEVRTCTTCMHRDVKRPAKFVAQGKSGMQWWACQECVDAMRPSFDEPMLQYVEIAWWLRYHGLPEFDLRSNLQHDLDESAAVMDAAQAVLEEA